MKGYKTIAVNGAIAALPFIDSILNHGDLVASMLGNHGPVVLSMLGLINIVLRWITTTPVLKAK